MKVKGYTKSDGTKVKGYTRIKGRASRGRSAGLSVNAHEKTIKRKASRRRK